jgi:geranylgeranyl pyrophosphate synthase
MLHAASLVHDDLPALDNDDMRRGRPSCHRQFNEATAILTGDYLVGRAFSVVTEGSLTATQQLRILATLAQAWGDLCMGQQVDIEKPTEPSAIHHLMELKTGALFGAAAASGAVCADTDDQVTTQFYVWGKKVGVLFQKLDDLADGDGTTDLNFNRNIEIEALLSELRALSAKPMHLTEAVYRTVVGQELT